MKKRKILGSLVIIALLFISCTNPFFKDFLVSENSSTNTNKTNAEVPKISSHSNSEITVTLNENFTLTIEASISDGGTLSYQWYSNNTNSNSGGTAITGATNSTYTVPTNLTGVFYYYCVVTNTNNTVNGNTTATTSSAVAIIKVIEAKDAETPTISSHPESTTVKKGNELNLTIQASVSDGGTLSYQWYSNSTNSITGASAISGETNSTYTVPTTTEGTFYYYCVVKNTNNSVNGNQTATETSDIAEVIVNDLTNAETPSITSQPQSENLAQGETRTIFVTASIFDGGTLSYQWYSNSTSSTDGASAISSATNSTYTVPTTVAGTTFYYCVVTNTNNSVDGNKTATATSNIAKIEVLAKVNAQTTLISTQPQSDTVIQGNEKELSIVASVSDGGTLTYQWYSNSTDSNSGGTLLPSATNATYQVSTNTVGTYHYYCVVTNINNSVNGTKTATKTSSVATITVKSNKGDGGFDIGF